MDGCSEVKAAEWMEAAFSAAGRKERKKENPGFDPEKSLPNRRTPPRERKKEKKGKNCTLHIIFELDNQTTFMRFSFPLHLFIV